VAVEGLGSGAPRLHTGRIGSERDDRVGCASRPRPREVLVDGHQVWKSGVHTDDARWEARSSHIVVTGIGTGSHPIRWTA
jgi:hypothetical protein